MSPLFSPRTNQTFPQGKSLKMRHRRSRFILAVCAGTILATQAHAAAQPNVPNPPWPARCPLKLGLVVDQSSSMSAQFDDVRAASRNVVDALRDKPSEVTIIGFGTDAKIIRSGVDVSDEGERHRLKDEIDGLDAHTDDDSATNWDAALTSAHALSLDVVVLVTDGLPNVHGSPAQEDPEALPAAVAAANLLKSSGTRLAAVGINLQQDGEENLKSITGPVAGTDYYSTDTAGLLRQLYGIVASACGVTIAQLPTPEPPEFPWLKAILGTLAGLLLITLAAFALYRRRHDTTGRTPSVAHASRSAVSDPTIDHRHLARQLRGTNLNQNPTTKDHP